MDRFGYIHEREKPKEANNNKQQNEKFLAKMEAQLKQEEEEERRRRKYPNEVRRFHNLINNLADY